MSDDDLEPHDGAPQLPSQPAAPAPTPAPTPALTPAAPAAPADAEAWVVPPPPNAAAPAAMPAHAVPATPLSEGTNCPRCGTENRPGIAFCRSCGQRLLAPGAQALGERPAPPEGTQACPRCGRHNRAGVPFCQNCGANLRATDPAGAGPAATAPARLSTSRAILGPVVLLIAAAGMLTAWLLPFAYGGSSLWDRSFGAPGGYGIGFWQGYPAGGLGDAAYFGLAAPVPVLVALLAGLAVAGFVRAAPGTVQRAGLSLVLAWGLGLSAFFILDELIGGPGGDVVRVLRSLSPAGIIFLLSGLITAIGGLTRLSRA